MPDCVEVFLIVAYFSENLQWAIFNERPRGNVFEEGLETRLEDRSANSTISINSLFRLRREL